MKKEVLLGMMVLALTVSTSMAGLLVNFDFGKADTNNVQSGAAMIGATGDVWNDVGKNADIAALLDSTGAATTIGFTTNIGGSYRYAGGSAPAEIFDMVCDWIEFSSYNATTTKTMTITGLQANAAFTLYIAGGERGQDSRGGTYSVDGVNYKAVSALYKTESVPYPMVETDNYVVLTGNTTAAGEIVVSVQGTYDGNKYQSKTLGMQLEMVPEPATLVLLGIGSLLLRKRR